MVKPPKLGPNLGRSGVLGARDPPGSAPRVPAPEGVVLSASSTGDSHHSGDTPEDGKAASGARQPAARGSQRRDVSTNTIPSEPDIALIALQRPGQTSTVSSGTRALSEYAENAESPTRVNPSRAVTPPETTAPSRQPAAPSLPQRRLRRQGVSGCQHLYFNKAKNSYGHNYECSLCGRQWYQPWHPNATGPISQRECIILSDPPH